MLDIYLIKKSGTDIDFKNNSVCKLIGTRQTHRPKKSLQSTFFYFILFLYKKITAKLITVIRLSYPNRSL